ALMMMMRIILLQSHLMNPFYPPRSPILSMGDEHLDTIPATESDEFIKSGIPEHVCDVPSHDNSPPLDISNDQIEDFSESNEEFSLTDDDSFSFDNIDYVEASPPDYELVSSEGDMLLFEAFLNDDHSSDFKTKSSSSSTSLNSLLEENNNFNNSLPEFTTFSKVLFDAECESDSSDDQSSSDEDVLEKIDIDSLMEKIDLFCTPDYPMPPGIVDEDYDSERDILIRKDLPRNNTLSFAEKESFYFDIPPFSRPHTKPPDGDTGIFNIKMMGDIYDQ
nr:hypothetical protein [Tanacetum cinerariifolium]